MTENKTEAEKPSASDNGNTRLPLIAYPISPLDMPLMVAPAGRDWMATT